MLRILHTSDWHLGHTLHDVPRAREHAAFLDWLLDVLDREAIDALLVAGDIYDAANPPADAQEAFYRFLATARRRRRDLDIVVIGGNHDSAARLDAPDPVLRALDVRVVGGMTRNGRALDPQELIVPLRDAAGGVAAHVAAVPFLRPFELPSIESDDPFVGGVRAIYERVIAAARSKCGANQAIVAMGHCYMTGTTLSELSERKILGGNQHALPDDIFPDDIAYAALGHLHLAQKVGKRDSVRYSGSPIPLALSEEPYRHRVFVVELEGAALRDVRGIDVPRAVQILRIGADDPLPIEEALAAVAKLDPLDPTMDDWKRPYLEVCVRLARPEPDLRQRVDQALEGKAAKLLRIGTTFTGNRQSLGDSAPLESLKEMKPEDVFRKCYARSYESEPSPELLASFAELVEEAQGAER